MALGVALGTLVTVATGLLAGTLFRRPEEVWRQLLPAFVLLLGRAWDWRCNCARNPSTAGCNAACCSAPRS